MTCLQITVTFVVFKQAEKMAAKVKLFCFFLLIWKMSDSKMTIKNKRYTFCQNVCSVFYMSIFVVVFVLQDENNNLYSMSNNILGQTWSTFGLGTNYIVWIWQYVWQIPCLSLLPEINKNYFWKRFIFQSYTVVFEYF